MQGWENWQVSIEDSAKIVEGVEDIRQCIHIILTTIPGSDPLRPEFGSDVYRYLDRPHEDIEADIIYAVTQSLARWEKRITVTKCTLTRKGIDGLIVTVEGETAAGTIINVPVKLR